MPSPGIRLTSPPQGTRYKPLPGYPGYLVGADGSIWSRHASGGHLLATWYKMRCNPMRTGHLRVGLKRADGSYINWAVAAVVLTAHASPCPAGKECSRHFPDRTPTNNRIENLRWGTLAENNADMLVHGTQVKGVACHSAKLTPARVRLIRRLRKLGWSFKWLGARFGVRPGAVRSAVIGRTWKSVAEAA